MKTKARANRTYFWK